MDNEQDLVLWYLEESGGSSAQFFHHLSLTCRIGQSFFNSLTAEDQNKLRGTDLDPYYKGMAATMLAIDFLTTI